MAYVERTVSIGAKSSHIMMKHILPNVFPVVFANTVLSAAAAISTETTLSFLGLGARLTHRPAELSGGEQQRVAIARAVANAPRILLADEPTGNLDPVTADHVFATLMTIVRASGLAALVATHNLEIAARMDRRVTIRDGYVVPLD